MSVRIHTADASSVAMSILDTDQLIELYGFDDDNLDGGLVIEDGGNCEAMLLQGTDDEIAQFAYDILARLNTKPTVVVIENPENDPDTYIMGNIEVIELSSYPATQWAHQERDDLTEYPGDMRTIADGVQHLPGDGPRLAERLRWLADEYDRRSAEKG